MTDFVFRTWDAGGVLTFDTGDRLGRVLGKIEIDGAAGNGGVDKPELANGTPFATFYSDGSGSQMVMCFVEIVGTRINWTFRGNNANQGANPSGFINYGIF